jgi:hypothetical protein
MLVDQPQEDRTDEGVERVVMLVCAACGDAVPVDTERRHCLCGSTSARAAAGGEVVVAGPGRIYEQGGWSGWHELRGPGAVRRPALVTE